MFSRAFGEGDFGPLPKFRVLALTGSASPPNAHLGLRYLPDAAKRLEQVGLRDIAPRMCILS